MDFPSHMNVPTSGWKTIPILELLLNGCVIIFSLTIWFQQARVSVSSTGLHQLLCLIRVYFLSGQREELNLIITYPEPLCKCACPEI